jgi:hypothetical protein
MMARDSKQVDSLFLTSPRLRGEVGLRFSAIRARGPLGEVEPVETPPHPNPLPARGERGQAVLGLEA